MAGMLVATRGKDGQRRCRMLQRMRILSFGRFLVPGNLGAIALLQRLEEQFVAFLDAGERAAQHEFVEEIVRQGAAAPGNRVTPEVTSSP